MPANGLEGIELDKALRKVQTRELALMTFKTVNDHIIKCTQSSQRVERAVKFVALTVLSLALEKLAEIIHITHFIGWGNG